VHAAAGRLADDHQARAATEVEHRPGRVRQDRFAQPTGARLARDALEAQAFDSGHGL